MLHKKLEIYGLILVLSSSFIQFFLLNKSQDTAKNAVIYKLEKKIDLIYSAARSNYEVLTPDKSLPIFVFNKKAFNTYEYAGDNGYLENTTYYTDLFGKVVAILFILGSTLIVFGKYAEINITQKVN